MNRRLFYIYIRVLVESRVRYSFSMYNIYAINKLSVITSIMYQ